MDISADILPLLRDFSCGVKDMDEILHSHGLLAEIYVEDPVAYCVHAQNNELVGFCIIGKINFPIEYEGHTEHVDMVDIACLAVRKDYQCRGIGTAILNLVCNKAEDFIPNVEFLHVDALDLEDGTYSAIPFYQKYGFQYAARAGQDVACMFYMLHEADK